MKQNRRQYLVRGFRATYNPELYFYYNFFSKKLHLQVNSGFHTRKRTLIYVVNYLVLTIPHPLFHKRMISIQIQSSEELN